MKGAKPMLKLIPGLNGEGKTKSLIALVNKAALEEPGAVVCIEHGNTLTFDIPHSVRLIQLEKVYTTDFFKGFISGVHSGNYDITHIFVDGIQKMLKGSSAHEVENFFEWCNSYGEAEGVRFTMTVTSDADSASEVLKKFF